MSICFGRYFFMAKTKGEIQKEYEKRTGYAAQRKYAEQNLQQYKFSLNKKTDSDIIEKLENVTNKTGYFKKLIREDIEREKKE